MKLTIQEYHPVTYPSRDITSRYVTLHNCEISISFTNRTNMTTFVLFLRFDCRIFIYPRPLPRESSSFGAQVPLRSSSSFHLGGRRRCDYIQLRCTLHLHIFQRGGVGGVMVMAGIFKLCGSDALRFCGVASVYGALLSVGMKY